jgi:hypothetical protein
MFFYCLDMCSLLMSSASRCCLVSPHIGKCVESISWHGEPVLGNSGQQIRPTWEPGIFHAPEVLFMVDLTKDQTQNYLN